MILDQIILDIRYSDLGTRRRSCGYHLANCTLVCRDWMQQFSPFLFEHTVVHSKERIHQLLMQAKGSERLSANISGLRLHSLPLEGGPKSLDAIILTFPHLREITFDHCEWHSDRFSLPTMRRHTFETVNIGSWMFHSSCPLPGYLAAFERIALLRLTLLRGFPRCTKRRQTAFMLTLFALKRCRLATCGLLRP